MNDKICVLLIDDVNDYISYPVLKAEELVLIHIDTWTKAQHILNTQTESISPDIVLIDINFQEDHSAPRWKQAEGEMDFGDKKPTGLFIGLAFSGMLYKSGLPRIGSIYSADPSLFRNDPATRTAAALLDVTINRPNKLWTQVSIDNWFDSFNLGSDPHHACKAALVKLREKIIAWCQNNFEAQLAVSPTSHWRVEKALSNITENSKISEQRNNLTLEFISSIGIIRKLNLCSLFAECDLLKSLDKAKEFLKSISYFPTLLKDCVEYAEKVDEGSRLTAIVPDTKPLERVVVVILLLLKWWKQKPEQWKINLNYAWDLDNNCPSAKPNISLKSYLKKLANSLTEFNGIDILDLASTSENIEAYFLTKGSQYSIFTKKVLSEFLPMLFKAGVLKKTGTLWFVLNSKVERDNKIELWAPDTSGLKFLQQDFLDSLQMQTNQFQRIIQDVNKEYGFVLPIYWENNWKGNGTFQLPCFFRVMFQDYVKEYLNWTKQSEWPSWLLDTLP